MSERNLQIDGLAGYPPEIGRALWMLEDTRRRTKETLAGLSQTVLDWDIAGAANTIGTLLYHMALIEADWLYAEILERNTDPMPAELAALFPYAVRDDQAHLTPLKGLSLDEHLQRLEATRALLLAAFQEITLADFRRVRHLPHYDVTPEWVLHHLMQHEAEHRGQIGELRKFAEQALV